MPGSASAGTAAAVSERWGRSGVWPIGLRRQSRTRAEDQAVRGRWADSNCGSTCRHRRVSDLGVGNAVTCSPPGFDSAYRAVAGTGVLGDEGPDHFRQQRKEGCHPRTRHSPDVPPHEEHGHTKETENAIEHQPECRAYADDRPLLSPQWVVEIFVHFSIAVICEKPQKPLD